MKCFTCQISLIMLAMFLALTFASSGVAT